MCQRWLAANWLTPHEECLYGIEERGGRLPLLVVLSRVRPDPELQPRVRRLHTRPQSLHSSTAMTGCAWNLV